MSVSLVAHDAVHGLPAAGVLLSLERLDTGLWVPLARAETDRLGCIRNWYEPTPDAHTYRLTIDCDRYFACLGFATTYPEIIVVFRLLDESRSYQIEMLLAPNAYSVYIGTSD